MNNPKIDYRKEKNLYFPKTEPALVEVPQMNFLFLEGGGAPEGKDFQEAIGLLYGVSYTLKMKFKDDPDYLDYSVYPLEALWWCNGDDFDLPRNLWCWNAMIRQPDFVTKEMAHEAIEIVQKKTPKPDCSKIKFDTVNEGLSVQIMHMGTYETEPLSIQKITKFIEDHHLTDRTKIDCHHHEIYLSDPRKTKVENLKTVLRYPVFRQVDRAVGNGLKDKGE